jgi:hypothetical protein
MKNLSKLLIALLIITLSVSVPAVAQRQITAPKGGALKIGTLGAGLEFGRQMNSKTTLKLNVNAFNYDYDDTESGIDYDFELKLMTAGLLVDYHPSLDNNFRITGGFFYNGNEVDATGRLSSTANTTIGAGSYSLAAIGTLNGSIDFDEFAPYIGIGWGRLVDAKRNGRFTFDLGVVFQGSPDVTLTVSNPAASAALKADLKAEELDLENELDDFEYYPVVSIGYIFNF